VKETTMTLTFKALAALLAYPSDDLVAALPEILGILEGDRRLPRRVRADLAALVDELRSMDPLDAQERYVATFDRGRAACLHLFEHVHGESRDRGQAMVDLKSMYERAGLVLAGHELPDYLPALLEFLSLQPFEVAEAMLDDCAHVVRKVGDALASRGSCYAAVFAAILAVVDLPGLTGKAEAVDEKPMDEEWAEAPVVFGPAAGAACGAPMPAQSIIQFVPRAGEAR
jgi:nitrate reductase delta subunit